MAACERLQRTLHDPDTPPAAQAAVARELRMMLAVIAARPKDQGDDLDELASRRAARRAAKG